MFYPQSNFYSQSFNPLASAGQIPFANTLYGFPQQSPIYSQQSQQPLLGQGQAQYPNWQLAQQQLAALQQHALQQLLAHQLAAQQFGVQTFPGASTISGISNGANGTFGPALGVQQQAQPQQPYHQLLQQLAQYHYLIAQQLSQLAAQQAPPIGSGAYVGQLGSGFQPGSNYMPGGTMH